MFNVLPQYQGFVLPDLKIGLDMSRAVDGEVFISHAHGDHMPKSKRMSVFATPATAALLRARGYRGGLVELPFYQPVELERARVTFYPAGHILGSAMTYIESDLGNILYTGDFKTPPSPVSEGFAYPNKVDFLITEATFGLPLYKWLPHETLFEQIRDVAKTALDEGITPVFYGYNLGKAQEILHALAPLNITTMVPAAGYSLCRIYEDYGMNLGHYVRYNEADIEGCAVVAPQGSIDVFGMRTVSVSGWATLQSRSKRSGAQVYIPLSDHIDFFELLRWIEVLQPKKVHITHTPDASVLAYYLERMGIASGPL